MVESTKVSADLQQPVAAVEAQATWRLSLQNRELLTERKDLCLRGSAGSKTGGCQNKKSDEKRAHRCSHHDLTNDRNFCVFRSDGVFSNHTINSDVVAPKLAISRPLPSWVGAQIQCRSLPRSTPAAFRRMTGKPPSCLLLFSKISVSCLGIFPSF